MVCGSIFCDGFFLLTIVNTVGIHGWTLVHVPGSLLISFGKTTKWYFFLYLVLILLTS